MGRTSTQFLATVEQTGATARHGEFYRAITLASRPGGLPPSESIEGATIKQASADYGVEFVGPLPDQGA